jgi:hypothetical protein
VFKINRRALLGLVPVLAMTAFAVAPSAAMAAGESPCRVLTSGTSSQGQKATCNNPFPFGFEENPQNLRENSDHSNTEPIIGTDFPTDTLAVNTKGKLRFTAKIAGVAFRNETPLGYGFVGMKLESNPVSSATECKTATGVVPSVDMLDSSPSAVFNGTSAWSFAIRSDSTACTEPGKVTISNVSLLFETLGAGKSPIVAAGSIAGVYEQPGVNCPAGGIKLNTSQPGITTKPTNEGVEVDNGETGKNAYLCFVAANNYLYSSSAPTWALTEGTGIWQD